MMMVWQPDVSIPVELLAQVRNDDGVSAWCLYPFGAVSSGKK